MTEKGRVKTKDELQSAVKSTNVQTNENYTEMFNWLMKSLGLKQGLKTHCISLKRHNNAPFEWKTARQNMLCPCYQAEWLNEK